MADTDFQPSVEDREGQFNLEVRELWNSQCSTNLPEVFQIDDSAHRMLLNDRSLILINDAMIHSRAVLTLVDEPRDLANVAGLG
jgi:hypothetical protein